MVNAATMGNIERKSAHVDVVQMRDGRPIPSLIELSLTELCNRECVFCPRVDPDLYPNQNLHMSLSLVEDIARELRAIEYRGTVVLCGFGEPMLHPNPVGVLKRLAGVRTEMVTNGDRLTIPAIAALHDAGLGHFVVSMYDGPHQVDMFKRRFHEAGVTSFTLRDRWHTADDDFGLKLTNRAGTVSAGNQSAIDTRKPCHYLAYQMVVDWNGDVLLCVQDWHKRVKFGNLSQQSLLDVWNSPAMHKRRVKLIGGNRCGSPCSGCNADGTVHGGDHAKGWPV